MRSHQAKAIGKAECGVPASDHKLQQFLLNDRKAGDIHVYVCTCTCVCIYIYIYIYKAHIIQLYCIIRCYAIQV